MNRHYFLRIFGWKDIRKDTQTFSRKLYLNKNIWSIGLDMVNEA